MFSTSTVLMGALLALLVTLMLPALTSPQHFRFHLARTLTGLRFPDWRDLARCELGVATITYTSAFSGNGASVAPTAIQASQLQVQTAEVNFLDGDTQAVVVHNWGSVQGFPAPASWAQYLLPYISYYCLQQTATPTSFATAFTFGITNTNSITVNKTSVGVGSGGTFAIIMRRN